MAGTDNLKETLESIDTYIAEKRIDIKRGEQLQRLMKNPDFIDVIMNGYIEVEAKKLFKILTDPTGASPYSPEETQMKLSSISDFKGYVGTEDYPGTVMMDAQRAPFEIEREENERIRVTADYAENGE